MHQKMMYNAAKKIDIISHEKDSVQTIVTGFAKVGTGFPLPVWPPVLSHFPDLIVPGPQSICVELYELRGKSMGKPMKEELLWAMVARWWSGILGMQEPIKLVALCNHKKNVIC